MKGIFICKGVAPIRDAWMDCQNFYLKTPMEIERHGKLARGEAESEAEIVIEISDDDFSSESSAASSDVESDDSQIQERLDGRLGKKMTRESR
jgi:hypothetical protein